MALLGYNSHTIEVIYLKCPIEWCLVYPQSCATIIIILEYLHHLKKNLHIF